LKHKIFAFQKALRSPTGDAKRLGQDLYKHLIAPIADDLDKAGAKLLMVYLDGPMRYIPLAALHNGNRYVVEDYAVVTFTPSETGTLKDPPKSAWRIAGMGVTREHGTLPALKGVEDELRGIVRKGDRGLLTGDIFIDDDFTAKRLNTVVDIAIDRPYQVLHIASHYVFKRNTEESFLVLGNDKEITFGELKHLPLEGLDLMILSACKTAVGDGRNANGLEIEGLGVMAQSRGAKAVVASLWSVSDSSTALLMQNLYRQRVLGKCNKAQALRHAQLQLLHPSSGGQGAVSSNCEAPRSDPGAESQAPYAHPYYWAPFILIGNWL
jgi:CHAT domain-containing protein